MIKQKPKTKLDETAPTRPNQPTTVGQQEQPDEETIEEWKATFMEREEKKRLGEKEYRIRRARKNKERVDQVMKSIKESKQIEIED